MREPAFWWRPPGALAALWTPAACVYGAIAARRLARTGTRTGVPIICVGNFTLGGAGKTPTAIALAAMLAQAGEQVFCLSRGYGGSASGPKRVDAGTDTAASVGDEALLLARAAPTIVARDRRAGARLAQTQGASVIVLDDGLQNPSLAKDFTLAVIDARRSIGNGKVFPAGPLRAPLPTQLARTDALLVVGGSDIAREIAACAPDLPVFHGRLAPDLSGLGGLKARRVLAFAGIGDPKKFFATADAVGIDVAQRAAFPDHHRFTAEEAAELEMRAEHDGLALLTTEKDHVRMTGDPLLQALAARVHVLPVTLQIDEAEALRSMMMKAIKRNTNPSS
jgi:tetraacyldisaccharide 4'-kinase